MESLKTSVKHLQIDKANNFMLIVVAVCTVAIVFSLVSSKTLLGQSSYQKKVLSEKKKAIKQLQDNIAAAKTLKTQYDVFVKGNPNIIGGIGGSDTASVANASGQDGDNAKIVLDALPSEYDFPALISSIEKIATTDHVGLEGITGTDQGQDGSSDAATAPTAAAATSTGTTGTQGQTIGMNFSVSAKTDYNSTLTLIKDFERSIRPFDITRYSITGSASNIGLSLDVNTYYQPSVSLEIGQKEVTK